MLTFAPALASLVLALGQVSDGAPAGTAATASAPTPWAAFAQDGHVVVRSFADGGWTTRGAALGAGATSPSLDFAGPRRTIPVAAWAQDGGVQAARLDGTDWVPMQSPGAGDSPALAGGATTAATIPAPWVAWVAPGGQVRVARGVKDAPWAPVGGPLNTAPAQDPDITFAGPDDTTPWVSWLQDGKVFAARAMEDGTDFSWERFGPLNANAAGAAPRIATGPRVPGGIAVPWVVWSEGGAILSSRLVGGTHFEPADDGHPLTPGTDPDIAFSGGIPYVSWRQDGQTFSGHLTDAGFVVDGSLPGGAGRAPIGSSCPSNPLTDDGTDCPGLGTPFLLQADAGRLLGAAYGAGVLTGDGDAAGHVTGTADPAGAPVTAHFEYGPTATYGARTPDVRLTAPGAFAADLPGLPAGTTIHYRAVAQTDFQTVAGEDRTLVTGPDGTPPAADQTPATVAPAPAPAAAPATVTGRLRSVPGALVYRFRWRGRITVFTRLRLRGVPARARVRVTRDGRATQLKQIRGRRLRAGTVIEIRLTKPGMQGVLVRLTTRQAQDPLLTSGRGR